MTFNYVEQLAVPAARSFIQKCDWSPAQLLQDWIEDRVDELIYTADDMALAAASLGDEGPPFIWDPERRSVLRAELDGAMFYLYGIEREDVEYILGTFPVVNRNDVKKYGEERTSRSVLDAFDRIAEAVKSGTTFVSSLEPAPGGGCRHSEIRAVSAS